MSQPVDLLSTRVEMAQIVLPGHTNHHGTCFGGQIAAWCDICAAISAQRFCRSAVVTASMDELHFLRAIKRGMVVILQSQLNLPGPLHGGGRSRRGRGPETGLREHCSTAYLTFVAVDAEGRPVPSRPCQYHGSADDSPASPAAQRCSAPHAQPAAGARG